MSGGGGTFAAVNVSLWNGTCERGLAHMAQVVCWLHQLGAYAPAHTIVMITALWPWEARSLILAVKAARLGSGRWWGPLRVNPVWIFIVVQGQH